MPFSTVRANAVPKNKLTEQKKALEIEVSFLGQKIEEAEIKEQTYKNRTREVELLNINISKLTETLDKKNSEFEVLERMIADREKAFLELKGQINNRVAYLRQEAETSKSERNLLELAVKSLTNIKESLFLEIEKKNKEYEALVLANENIEKIIKKSTERYTKSIITFKGEMDAMAKELEGKEKLLTDKKKLTKEISEKEILLENTRLEIDTAQLKLIETNKEKELNILSIKKTYDEFNKRMNDRQKELEAKEHELTQREVLLDKQKRYLKGFKEKLEMKLGTPLENITI